MSQKTNQINITSLHRNVFSHILIGKHLLSTMMSHQFCLNVFICPLLFHMLLLYLFKHWDNLESRGESTISQSYRMHQILLVTVGKWIWKIISFPSRFKFAFTDSLYKNYKRMLGWGPDNVFLMRVCQAINWLQTKCNSGAVTVCQSGFSNFTFLDIIPLNSPNIHVCNLQIKKSKQLFPTVL